MTVVEPRNLLFTLCTPELIDLKLIYFYFYLSILDKIVIVISKQRTHKDLLKNIFSVPLQAPNLQPIGTFG